MLLRLLVSFLLLFINLYACKGGYSSCVAKVKDSHTIQKQILYIPITPTKRLCYGVKKPHGKIIKYDKFLSLYFLKSDDYFSYPFESNLRVQLGTALVTNKNAKEGKFLSSQVGLNKLARYTSTDYPALITSSCCSLEGIVTPRGVIQKEYINHFLNTKDLRYGDIGVRLEEKDHKVFINEVDPFVQKNPFKKGDVVIAFDTKKVYSAAKMMQYILFSKITSKHKITILRGSVYKHFNVYISQRYGGGEVSDTFLESKGLYFNSHLQIIIIAKKAEKYLLHKGDKLLQIDGKRVANEAEVRAAMNVNKKGISLLFERNGFQFFVYLQ